MDNTIYNIDVTNAEELLRLMGYNWKDHYESYSDFVMCLSETLQYNFKSE